MQNTRRTQGENTQLDCHATTCFSVLEYRYKWTLKQFSKIMTDIEINSPRFYPEFKIPWWISIHKRLPFHRSEGKYSVTVKVHRIAVNDKCVAEFELTSIDGGSNMVLEKNTGCLNFINSLAAIMSTRIQNLSNDVVELVLLLKIHKENSTQLDTSMEYFHLSKAEFQQDVQRSLSCDLNTFYERDLFTDITLSMEEGSLKAHKAILSARSLVFANMFQQEMVESTNNVVVIEDVKMATMNEVVAFMYGRAKRDYDFETALEVYYAADKYDVKNLKKICACILASNLNMDNAYNILQLADRHDDKWLTKQVIKFITFHSDHEEDAENYLLGRTKK